MKHKLLLFAVATSLVFTACKKDDDDDNNNNNGGSGEPTVIRKTIKEYGFTDSSQKLIFTFQNNEKNKLKKMSAYTNGSLTQVFEVLYGAGNKPEGFELRALPVDTISSQGKFKTDSKGRIIEILNRKPNTSDTISIFYVSYASTSYQPIVINFYDKSKMRITDYHNLEYDDDGNLLKIVTYKDNGADPMYKQSEVNAVYSDGVNPLQQLFFYTVINSQNPSSLPLYFSDFGPLNISQQTWKVNGDLEYTNVQPYTYDVDKDNNITGIGSNNNSTIYIKY